jgi:hypothetical protein
MPPDTDPLIQNNDEKLTPATTSSAITSPVSARNWPIHDRFLPGKDQKSDFRLA